MAALVETRNFWPATPRLDGVTRVITIGDSVTYGQGVPPDGTLAAHLEDFLNAAHIGRLFEARNHGQSSGNLWHSWAALRHHDLIQGADLIVLTLCANDSQVFESNTVHYENSAQQWTGDLAAIVHTTLAEVGRLARRHEVPVIVTFFTFREGDEVPRAVVAEACAAAGLPFLDLYNYLHAKTALTIDTFACSPFDGHPSVQAHQAAARCITEEVLRLGLFPATEDMPDIATGIRVAIDAMRDQGRAPDEFLQWGLRTLASKMRAHRRLGRAAGLSLGDTAPLRQLLDRDYRAWRGGLQVAAATPALAGNPGDFWTYCEWLYSSVRNLDEILYLLEVATDDTLIEQLGQRLLGGGYYPPRVRDLAQVQPAHLQEVRRWVAARPDYRRCGGIDGTPAGAVPVEGPACLATVEDLKARFLRLLDRLLVLSDIVEQRFEGPRADILRIADVVVQDIHGSLQWLDGRIARWASCPDGDPVFLTTIDVIVETPGASGLDRASTSLYVEVDYLVPKRMKCRDKHWCGIDIGQRLYRFKVPLLVAGTVSVFVSRREANHEGFLDGRNQFARVDIYNDPGSPRQPVWTTDGTGRVRLDLDWQDLA